MGVGRHRAEDICVQHVEQPLAPLRCGPADPRVPWTKGKDRICEAKNANEFPVVVVEDEEAEPTSVARRDRNTPVKGYVAKEKLVDTTGKY